MTEYFDDVAGRPPDKQQQSSKKKTNILVDSFKFCLDFETAELGKRSPCASATLCRWLMSKASGRSSGSVIPPRLRPLRWPTWTPITLREQLCGAQCLFSPFCCSDSLFQKPSRESRHRGERLLWIHSVKAPHTQVQMESSGIIAQLSSNHVHTEAVSVNVCSKVSPGVSSVSEPFTLLRTRSLKMCSTGCSSPTVDWCTCPLLESQVRTVAKSQIINPRDDCSCF